MYRVTREIIFVTVTACSTMTANAGTCMATTAGHDYARSPELDALGMVIDFSQIKRIVSGWIDDALDHRMLLHQDDPVLPYLKEQGEPVYVMKVNPTAE